MVKKKKVKQIENVSHDCNWTSFLVINPLLSKKRENDFKIYT